MCIMSHRHDGLQSAFSLSESRLHTVLVVVPDAWGVDFAASIVLCIGREAGSVYNINLTDVVAKEAHDCRPTILQPANADGAEIVLHHA